MRSSRPPATPRSVVIDARWLGFTGVGRVTGWLLDGLAAVDPPGRWTVWGGADAGARWPRAAHAAGGEPLAAGAQRAVLHVPQGDLVVYPHAVRPLTIWRRSAVLLHDVIPALYSPRAVERAAWRAFLALSVRSAWRVLVYSDATEERAVDLLHVRSRRIRRLELPVDVARAERIRALRRAAPRAEDVLLYVGQVKPHKNLARVLDAFAGSPLNRSCRFVLVGGRPHEVERLRAHAVSVGAEVDVRERCSDDELEQLYAAASAVVMPSLEEGFGLPVVEALASGIPVCCSDIPAHREAARGRAVLFDPLSVSEIRSAMERVLRLEAEPAELGGPTVDDFARQVLAALDLPAEPT